MYVSKTLFGIYDEYCLLAVSMMCKGCFGCSHWSLSIDSIFNQQWSVEAINDASALAIYVILCAQWVTSNARCSLSLFVQFIHWGKVSGSLRDEWPISKFIDVKLFHFCVPKCSDTLGEFQQQLNQTERNRIEPKKRIHIKIDFT